MTAIAIERKNPLLALELHKKSVALGQKSPELSYNLGLLLQSVGRSGGRGGMLSRLRLRKDRTSRTRC